MVRIVCWNTGYLTDAWRCLRDMDMDVGLVQEACNPPSDVMGHVGTGRAYIGMHPYGIQSGGKVVFLSCRIGRRWS